MDSVVFNVVLSNDRDHCHPYSCVKVWKSADVQQSVDRVLNIGVFFNCDHHVFVSCACTVVFIIFRGM